MKGLKQCLKLGIIGISLSLIFPSSFIISEESKDVISYTQFLDEVEKGKVKEIKIFCEKRIEGKYIDESKFTTDIPYYHENLIKILRKNKVSVYGEEPSEKELLTWRNLIPVMCCIVFLATILGLILYNKRVGLLKFQTLYWEKMPDYLNEIIKKLDSLIDVLKEKK